MEITHGPQIDYRSNDWREVTTYLRELYEDSVKIVMSHGITERESDFHRGRASLIEMMLDWNPYDGR